MAEIKIEKKKPIWPWILLVLILLAVIAYFVYANNENDDNSDDMEIEEVDDVNNNTFNDSTTYEDSLYYSDSTNDMMQYSESIQDSTRIGTDSTYTKMALQNLSKAVTAKAAKYNLERSKAMEDLKQYSGQMDGMSDSKMTNMTGISKNFKAVSGNIVTVLQSIQTKNFPALQKEVTDLKQTSDKLTSATIDKQQFMLQAFFRKANEVLNKMNS
jgi:hypothetical protein